MRTLAVLVVAMIVAGPLAIAAPGPRGTPAVTIKSASDTSPGVLDPHTRTRHGELVRRALRDALRRSGADVRHAGIPPRQLDITIVKWRVTPSAVGVDVSTELRVVVCDEQGKILSIVTGRARISAPGHTTPLVELRAQALAEAVGGMGTVSLLSRSGAARLPARRRSSTTSL